MNHPLPDMITSAMEKLQTLVDSNTVVGDPINMPDGTSILPISKVSYAIAGGGSDFTTKSQRAGAANPFGGGAGAGVTVTPVAFLVVKDGIPRMIPVAEPASTSMERLIEKAPEFADKLLAYLNEKSAKKSEE